MILGNTLITKNFIENVLTMTYKECSKKLKKSKNEENNFTDFSFIFI